MIKLEFPADRLDLARIFGRALLELAESSCEAETRTHGQNNKGDAVSYEQQLGRADRTTEAALGTDAGKDASSATGPGGHAETTTHGSADAAASGGEPTVDINGLEFNGLYCGVANDPFYGSGPRKGQWKKRRGVSDEEYDRWYAETKAKGATVAPIDHKEYEDTMQALGESTNTAAAFGNTATAESAPQTPGEFMGWTSERQAAGLLSQCDIEQVYAENGVAVTDLFGTHAAGVVEGHIATLHGHMSALIASRGTA